MDKPKIIRFIDVVAKPLVVISVIMYLIEEEMSLKYGWNNSHESPLIFLWAERFIAGLFTIEFIIRCRRASSLMIDNICKPEEDHRTYYPFNLLGAFDFIAIFPFWIGFFLPSQFLGLVRTLRILRLLKFFRYSRSLQLTFIKFYRAYHNVKSIAFSIGIVWLFFAVVCLQLEYSKQPENFGSLFDAAWFTIVTGTTVGYGDISPISIPGKIFVGLMLVPIIATIGASIAAVNAAFDKVQAEEDDPSIDPLEIFKKERDRLKRIKKIDREYKARD
jgi:voltage-gated potassium channel